MKKTAWITVLAAVLVSGSLVYAQNAEQKVYPAGSRASNYANQKNFIGQVRVDPGFQSQEPARAYGAFVTFEPGARTNWHVHLPGQTLVVMSGKGITQEWGKPATIIKPGDIVVCPPGVKHWHGAAPDTAMTHLAISERAEGIAVQWHEPVSDEQYQQAAKEK